MLIQNGRNTKMSYKATFGLVVQSFYTSQHTVNTTSYYLEMNYYLRVLLLTFWVSSCTFVNMLLPMWAPEGGCG